MRKVELADALGLRHEAEMLGARVGQVNCATGEEEIHHGAHRVHRGRERRKRKEEEKRRKKKITQRRRGHRGTRRSFELWMDGMGVHVAFNWE